MIKRKHIEHEHKEGCCCCDSYFNMLCEEDPTLEEKARASNEVIKQMMLKIKQEREKKNPS